RVEWVFFFQAEDGIRDKLVTGVQTCALPILLAASGQAERGLELLGRAAELAPDAHQIRLNFAKALLNADRKDAARKELELLTKRSEERRVGKEGQCRRAPQRGNKCGDREA